MKGWQLAYFMRKLYDNNQFLFWIILPSVVISVIAYQVAKENDYEANTVLIALSSLSPILGLICFLARQKEDKDAANVYLGCGIASFVVWVLLLVIL